MNRITITLIFGLISHQLISQVITCDPAIPTQNQPVTITFHADMGDKGLMNYSGDDVYAHTGVITDKSTGPSDWKYVKAGWTTNLPECKLTKISDNEYQLAISPNIRDFYGVAPGDKILKMAFVFRNSNGSRTGRDIGGADIFIDVYEEGLQVSFIRPPDYFNFAVQDEPFQISISANDADSILLFIDNTLIKRIAASSFDTAIAAEGKKRHELVTVAVKDNSMAYDTTWYMLPGVTAEESAPAGYEDGITYPANDSAIFVLFAPGKNYIYLIGDFNKWLPDSIYQFKKDGDRFWISLGDLTPGKGYAFQYLIDGELRVADPYSEKILDPFNDKFIPESVYPGLPAYPDDKTTQIAGVIHPGKPDFIWNYIDYIPPASKDLLIYELLIRDFVSSHDIKDVTDSLNYLQTLGINAIELMPFSEFEGNSSWGYNPSFYFAPDKYYGSDTDIKNFINECHNRGIAVIMDIVLNHAYGQNPMVRMYFNQSTGKPSPDNPWFNIDSPNPVYSWGYDFDHESAATQYFVDRVVEYWLTEYRVDGFRFDFTKGFTNTPGDGSGYDPSRISILKRIYDKIKSVNPDAYMICEHFAPNNEEKELSDYGMLIWGNSNYNYNEATMGYINNSDLSWSSYKSRGWTNPALISYMESHDEERLMFKNITYGNSSGSYNIKDTVTALARMELAGVFFFTIPGPKMIWQFGELGYDVSIDFNGRVGEKPVKWEYWNDDNRRHLYLVWARIMDIRKKYPVFQTDDFTLNVGNNVSLKRIILRHEDGDATVIGNFGLNAGEIQPGFTKTGWWYEVFTGDSVNITDVNSAVSLAAGEYRIYTAQKTKSVISKTGKIRYEPLLVYPNPVRDLLFIDNEKPVNIEILDISGTIVSTIRNIETGNPINVSNLSSGYYFIRINEKDHPKIGRFIKH